MVLVTISVLELNDFLDVQGPEGLSTISVQLGAEGRKRNRELVITLGRRMAQGGPMVGASAYVAGIEVWFEWDEREEEAELEVDVDALMTYLNHFTRLRVVNLSFSRYDDLLTVMRRYRPVSHNPQIHQRYYVLAYMRDRDDEFPQVRRAVGSGYDFVGIDPITLSPTGAWSFIFGRCHCTKLSRQERVGHGIPKKISFFRCSKLAKHHSSFINTERVETAMLRRLAIKCRTFTPSRRPV